MARAREQVDNIEDEESTSERIVTAATRLFATKGFDGTSTKEICDEADVNIAAIHYHFGSKEQLLAHILEHFGGARLRALQRILQPPQTHDELRVRLLMFLQETIEFFMQQPELPRLVQAEIELFNARSEHVFRGTFVKCFQTLVDFLSFAKRKKLLASDIDPRFAARALYSQICHQTRADSVNKKFYQVTLRDPDYRAVWFDQTLRIFLGGIQNKEERR